MLCPLCQFDNPAQARFCLQCGRRQIRICPSCGTELPASAKFCLECGLKLPGAGDQGPGTGSDERDTSHTGPRPPAPNPLPAPRVYTPHHLVERILTSRGAIEGERKHVTVLFVDMRGSLGIAEEVDPEHWHEIMDRFFAILADGVHRFEGTINQYTGDGIMALFGAPLALEAHAEGACSAALHLADGLRHYAAELRRTEGINLSMRMGLNSGEVVVGKIGDDLRMDYTAQGHTVGLAARMENLAAPDQVYLTESTAELVRGFFELRDLGPFQVKGVREPVRVYALEGVGPLRTRLDAARARGFSRFVGRTAEMSLLEGSLQQALLGVGGVFAIAAPPGVGKSRLYHEFAETCRSRGIRVIEAHCVPHGRTIPFLTVLDLLRQIFGIGERDSGGTARSKVAGSLLLLDPSLVGDLSLLLDFLGIPDLEHPAAAMDPEVRFGRLLELGRRLVMARSRREPAVIIVEDLHWIDPASERFLEVLVGAVRASRTLLLLNFRPTYVSAWTAEGDVQRIDLVPLGREASDALLSELLGGGEEVAPLAERIRERTGGNPFFIEEVVRSLFERRVLERQGDALRVREPLAEIQIPASVQAVLEARIDRLTESEKTVLQTAAVIGPEFAQRVLLQVAAQDSGLDLRPDEIATALRSLAAGDFILVQRQLPELVYAFRHPLTQEATSRSQLAARRGRIHAAVAVAVEALYADSLDERAALLAHHWEGAGDGLQAARWSRRAAEWVRHSNLAEAMRYRRKILELLRGVEETEERTRLALESYLQALELGWRLGLSAEDALQYFAEGEELATRVGDKRHLSMLVNAYAALRSHFGSAEDFVTGCERAVRLANETDDVGLQAGTRARLVVALACAGQLRKALQLSEEAVASPPSNIHLGSEVLGYSPYIRMIKEKGRFLIDAGRLDEGERELERAAALAHEHDDVEILGHVHAEYATLARVRGDAAAALAHAQEAMLIAEKLGSPFFRASASLAFGHAHILANRWPEAAEALSEVLRIARAGRAGVEAEPFGLAWLGAAHMGLGDLDVARQRMDEALEVARRRGTRLAECVARIGRARVLLRAADPAGESAAIDADLTHAMELAESTGATSNAPFAHLERSRLAAALGDQETRLAELRHAHRLFAQMGATMRAERVARELRG